MKLNTKYALIFLLLLNICFSVNSFSQQAAIDGSHLQYKKFSTNNFFVNNRGFGLGFRKGKHTRGIYDFYRELEFTTFRNPKETRVQFSNSRNGRRVVYGKLNNVMITRLGVGLHRQLYAKEVPNAIQLNWVAYAGLTVPIMKPVFLEVRVKNRNDLEIIEDQRYDPDIHTVGNSNVVGKARYFRGIGLTKVAVGGYAKAGVQADFASADDRINVIETGLILDFVPQGIPLMAFNNKERILLSIYLSYNIGSKKLQ
jgi:hypothetical protein